MSLLGTIGEELHDNIWKLREYVERLPVSTKNKQEMYSAIREGDVVVSPMQLTSENVRMINKLARNAKTSYHQALACAASCPRTNDCDEYAATEAKELWAEIKSPSEI